jgi:NAD(P)-dependent dehydrogenase (short-subunit alcohol dehydrogenase family)
VAKDQAKKQKAYTDHSEAKGKQKQASQPGLTGRMQPKPMVDNPDYKGSGKLQDQVALITGGDSGIGQAVAIIFAKEGADVAIGFLEVETEDALETKRKVEEYGRKCLLVPGDVRKRRNCEKIVEKTIKAFGKLNILVSNAAYQMSQDSILDIGDEQLERTFETNVYGAFYITQAALPHLKEGDTIIYTTSVTAYRGSPHLIDYSATKGALVALTRSLAGSLAEKKIRVNAVAPGPVWTPFIPSTFPGGKVEKFGEKEPLGRAGQPEEIAPAYVYLASMDSTYVTGQVIHVNGGEIVNG